MPKEFEEQYKRLGMAVPETGDREKAELIYNASCAKLGLDPNNLPEVSKVREKYQASQLAFHKLSAIRDAIVEDKEAEWNDEDEYKYGAWFWMDKPGFRLGGIGYRWAASSTGAGSRLCTFTEEDGEFFAKECIAFWADFMGGKLPK